MAITYVGGTSGTGTSTGYTVSLSGTLTGGSDSSPSTGDIVLVTTGFGSAGNQTGSMSCSGDQTGTYSQAHTPSFQNDTWDTNHGFYYAIQGSTPDSTITIGRQTNTAYGGVTTIHVWRGVDTVTPLDVTVLEAGSGNASRPDPPSITPVTTGAIVIAAGTGTQTTAGSAFTIPSGMTNGVSQASDGTTSDTGNFICSFEWTSGAYDPAAATGGTTSTSSSWRATTLALRPYVAPTQPLTPDLFSSATVAFFAATVGVGSVNLSPTLFSNDNTFYAPTVTQSAGGQNLSPSLVTNTETFYAPTVNVGAVSLSPTLVTNTEAFYSPTASVGAVDLTPSLYTNTQTFFSPTVSVGAQDLTPSLYSNNATFYTHSVTVGAVTLSPSLYSNSNVVYSPSVLVGPVALSIPLITNTQTFYSATVLVAGGPQFVETTLLSNTNTFYSATAAVVVTVVDQPQSAPWWEVEKEKKKRKKLEEEDVLKNELLKKQAEIALLLMTPH